MEIEKMIKSIDKSMEGIQESVDELRKSEEGQEFIDELLDILDPLHKHKQGD